MDLERNMSMQGGKKQKFMKMIQMSDGLEKAKAAVDARMKR